MSKKNQDIADLEYICGWTRNTPNFRNFQRWQLDFGPEPKFHWAESGHVSRTVIK